MSPYSLQGQGTLLAGYLQKTSEHSQADLNPFHLLIDSSCVTKIKRASHNTTKKKKKGINHCCQQVIFFCKILQLKTQIASCIVSRNACNIYDRSIRLFPVSHSPENPSTARAPRQTHLPVPQELLNDTSMQRTDRRTGILCWVHPGSPLPPAAHGYTPASSLALLAFNSCRFPEQTHQEQREALAQPGNPLPSCLHRRTVPKQRHLGHRSE